MVVWWCSAGAVANVQWCRGDRRGAVPEGQRGRGAAVQRCSGAEVPREVQWCSGAVVQWCSGGGVAVVLRWWCGGAVVV